MCKGATSSPSKLRWYLKAPMRALCRARDFYVHSMTGCVGRVERGAIRGMPAGMVSAMPRSQSQGFYRQQGGSTEDDIRELIRLADKARQPGSKDGVVPRSQSVATLRIDEDRPCEFEGLDMVPRSKSCAVAGNNKRKDVGVIA
ncbi:uncharacterized protein LOC103707553 [Phoenix dactylifera]|uniref:Uncharacterized protein LOC103707553 n=1 Tax=Phoenix dactylifera TaxID=42345 RepID=A0A8B7C2J1_PHODC|nr:uncharacterized protein LOC103707553 [Phoenix dactylifera]